MDSLTQIVLGAAVGELAAGKRLGNRALLWGAVGGTIPDLDILFGGLMTPLQELTVHRGFSHSIVFAILGAFLFGWLIDYIYQSSRLHRIAGFLGWLMIPVAVTFFITRFLEGYAQGPVVPILLILALGISGYFLYRKYFLNDVSTPDVHRETWQWLMFWTIFTHPLLDCFTTYGTQLFQPFSDYRVGFNVISVADPIYTVPFLICVILITRYSKDLNIRRKFAWLGLGISSAYMIFCICNKQRINNIWEDTLEKDGVEYKRIMSSPSIFNNVLWSCIAETEDGYLLGDYSLFDKDKRVNYHFVPRFSTKESIDIDDHTIERMRWFSNGYYNIKDHPEGFQFNDLRFGRLNLDDHPDHYIFNFVISADQGKLEMLNSNGGPPPGEEDKMLSTLWTRIKGI